MNSNCYDFQNIFKFRLWLKKDGFWLKDLLKYLKFIAPVAQRNKSAQKINPNPPQTPLIPLFGQTTYYSINFLYIINNYRAT